MAAPTLPDAESIATEGLKRAGITSPSAAQITAAETWLEDVKNDLYRQEKKLKSLYMSDAIILAQGDWLYSFPTDYASDLTLTLLSGTTTGTATGGGVNTLDLESGTSLSLGSEILITLGAASKSLAQAIEYSDPTVTVSPSWSSATASGSVYMIIDNYRKLDCVALWKLDQESLPTTQGKPLEYYPIEDDSDGQFYLRPVPDGEYGLKRRYYANLMELDLDSDLMTLLYKKWRQLFTQYVKYIQLDRTKDSRATNAKAEYERLLFQTILDETSGMGEDAIKIELDIRPHGE